MKKTFTALLVLGVAAIATPALSASHGRDSFIKEQDTNSDGKVTKEEFAEFRKNQFAVIDANKDGKLSREEYTGEFKARLEKEIASWPKDKQDEEMMRQMRQADVRFGVLDSDKSGFITVPEYEYTGWLMFAHHDTNKDGFVSAADPVKEDAEDGDKDSKKNKKKT